MSGRKELKKLRDDLKKDGWLYRRTGKGHHQMKSPDGRHIVVIPDTPSDPRTVKNVRQDLKRAGYVG